MPDDADFLAAIAAAPADRLLKLVYADYLDERSDPRGELVRIEDRLRDVPAFADEFWALKVRRNELRADAPPDWLAAMRYGVDVYPVFAHGWPDDWRGRWRLIREFAERWHGVPMGDIGGRREEVAEVEARVGRELPASVREFVAYHHDFERSGSTMTNREFNIVWGSDGEVLLLIGDDWGGGSLLPVVRPDSVADDPPALRYERADGADDWALNQDEPLDSSLTAFAFRHLCDRRDLRGSVIGYSTESGWLRAQLAEHLGPSTHIGRREVYERDGVLARLTSHTWGSVSCTLDIVNGCEAADLKAIRDHLAESIPF